MKEKLLAILLSTVMVAAALSGCGNKASAVDNKSVQTDSTVATAASNNEVKEATAEETENSEISETEKDNQLKNTAIQQEETEDTTAENETEATVEMPDFDTWAAQADNDILCMAIWNDINKTYSTIEQGNGIYFLTEGDRLAIPYREYIHKIIFHPVSEENDATNDINLEVKETPAGSYYEVPDIPADVSDASYYIAISYETVDSPNHLGAFAIRKKAQTENPSDSRQ